MQTTLLTSRAAEWESATFADKAEVCESSGALEALRPTPGRGSQDGRRVREDELTLDKGEDKDELALDVDGGENEFTLDEIPGSNEANSCPRNLCHFVGGRRQH